MVIGYESLTRLFNPIPIAFDEAIPIAVLGLGVNLLTAFLLRDDHDHSHEHDSREPKDQRDRHHHDHNLRAAFMHIVADAAVSVLVICGLVAGRQFGWIWLDPVMGLIATIVIINWSLSLIRSAGAILLDASPDTNLTAKIAARLETEGDRISDLHIWRLGPGHLAGIISLVTDHPMSPSSYKQRLSDISILSHVTIEVEQCPGHIT